MGGIQFFPKSFFELNYYPYYGKLRHVSAHLCKTIKQMMSLGVPPDTPPPLPTGELLLSGGGGAFHRGAVRHSPPHPVQTEREGHHQRLTHRPLPGQRDLLLGRRGVRQKKKKKCRKSTFPEICNSSFPHLSLPISTSSAVKQITPGTLHKECSFL